ncbi:MAG: tRNA pseudouridine55 synthase [Chloroflexi bacterium]|nr:MAG: tRNA pseudouridine55 synthase [Chloroflexota bacterium]
MLLVSFGDSLINGVLNMNKPEGWTSMDLVRLVKRLTREKRVGHGGTLDPQATGVLPILLGQATRLMEHLVNTPKLYRTDIVLGTETDTYDGEGSIVAVRDASHLSQERIASALASFVGVSYQVPPMYSALKQDGKRLYELARAGEEVPREPRKVVISRLEVVAWALPTLTVEVECHRGVYVRSLAHDLGEALEVGGHAVNLTRLRTGHYPIETALSADDLRDAADRGDWQQYVLAMDTIALHLRAAVVGPAGEKYLSNGQPVSFPTPRLPSLHQETCRLYSDDGRFLALANYNWVKHQWEPERVFASEKGKQATELRFA